MGKIIAIATPKGKVGKSTSAINLSAALALSGNRTMLIDLDPAGACITGLGFGKKEASEDIFAQKETITTVKPHLLKTKIINLELLRIRRLPYIKEEKSIELKKNEYILRNILRPELSHYDYIIMDCPPHLKGTMNACLIAADSILIPIVLAGFSIAVVSRMIAQADFIRDKFNHQLKIAGIFFTIFEKDNETAAGIKKELTEIYEEYILNTLIPKSSQVRQALNNKRPVVVYNPEDEAAKAYRQLAKELSEKKYFKIELLH